MNSIDSIGGFNLMKNTEFTTIKVHFESAVCYIQFDRIEANNTINQLMIDELYEVISLIDKNTKIVVLEGSNDIFCFGADFNDINLNCNDLTNINSNNNLYELWEKMINSDLIFISHVCGKVNAGGIGFVAASDIVIANPNAIFSLSELLFGLYPAMVFPFLKRKIGLSKANYLTLMTSPISANLACQWGLVDVCDERDAIILKRHISRLSKLPKNGVGEYKAYVNRLESDIECAKEIAITANRRIFSNAENTTRIYEFSHYGKYPWE